MIVYRVGRPPRLSVRVLLRRWAISSAFYALGAVLGLLFYRSVR